eukprot:NODE_597_length_5571_cov_0.535270.p3 type:complete len:161 gc:universal NODE_597_length_5571_cov_0.535270:4255-3773(-)
MSRYCRTPRWYDGIVVGTILVILGSLYHNLTLIILGGCTIFLSLGFGIQKHRSNHAETNKTEVTARIRQTQKPIVTQMQSNAVRNASPTRNTKIYIDDTYITTPNESECGICHEKLPTMELIVKTDCSHEFHRHCITKWYNSNIGSHGTCPICRDPLFKR